MIEWYFHDPGQGRVGPYTAEQLRARYRDRQIQLDTLVWHAGLREWQPLRQFAGDLSLQDVTPDASQPPPLSAHTAHTAIGAQPGRSGRATFADPANAAAVWYYSDYERNRLGPVGAKDLAELHAGGQLAPEALVWREGLAQWKPWREMMHEVVAAPLRVPSAASASHRASYAAGASGRDRAASAPIVYAGFWKRVAASVIDSFVLAIVGGLLGAMIGGILGAGGAGDAAVEGIVQVVSILIAAWYYAGFHASSLQATPGKLAIGIKVVRGDGDAIGFLRGVGRYFATILSALILCIGFAMAGFTERKQALHDLICDTLVVDRWAFTDTPDAQREELGTAAIIVLALGGLAFLGSIALFATVLIGLAGMAGS